MAAIVNLKKQTYAYLEFRVLNDTEGYISEAKIDVFQPDSMQSASAKETNTRGVYELVLEPGRYIV
jgi:hypothetical protein